MLRNSLFGSVFARRLPRRRDPLAIVVHVLETYRDSNKRKSTMPTAMNGITAASATNIKAIKSKNQLRRAKAKQKKATATVNQATPVSPPQLASSVASDAGRHIHAGTKWRRLEWRHLHEKRALGGLR